MQDRLPERDAELVRVVDDRMELAARLAGDHLACRPGCTDCCIGAFPITRLDALRLRKAQDDLLREDPERHARLGKRAAFTADALREEFPGDRTTGILGEDEEAEEAFVTRHATVPCPALDPADGTCDLYAARPITCRTFGPPVRLGDEDLPPCRLCFVDADRDVVDRCRIEPDPEGIEDAILDDLPDGDDQTLVAFALAGAAAR